MDQRDKITPEVLSDQEKADRYARTVFEEVTRAENDGPVPPELVAKMERALRYALRLDAINKLNEVV